jgi:hypothetical protein
MTFPANNLPTASRTWGREVEKKVSNLESSFRSAEVNNVTRDSQLSVTANAALSAATQAQAAAAQAQDAADDALAAANTANAAATQANAAATTANNAINGLGQLDEPTSTYKINAANLTVGTLSGDRISGGTITGTLLNTASGGPRLEMGTNNILFYDDTGDYSGKIDAEGNGRGSTLNLDQGGVSGMYIYNGGVELYANGPVAVNAQQLISYGGFSVTGNATVDQQLTASTVKVGGSSGSTLSREGDGRIRSDSGFLSSGPLGVTGNLTYVAPTGTGTTFPLYWNSTSNLVYRLSSSQRYKSNIQDAEFDYEALLEAKVRTFKNKQDIEEVGEDAAEVTYGYIAEELHDLGLTDFVVYENDENGNPRPESVNYMSMALASHAMIKRQDAQLKSLEARLSALESR